MKKIILLLVSILVAFASCEKPDSPKDPKQPDPIPVADIQLNRTALQMTEGEVFTLVVTISPKNADNQNVVWESSNPSIATVEDGKVSALSKGTATITAKSVAGEKTASCSVVVNPPIIYVSSIKLNYDKLSMMVGDEITLEAEVSPNDATDKTVVWSSSDSSIASVDNGRVQAIKSGTVKISAAVNNGALSTSCTITISPKLSSISFDTVDGSESNTLTITNLNATIKYSYDQRNWLECIDKQKLTFGNGQILYICGINNNNDSSHICHFEFSGEAKVKCSGNIMTLLDAENVPSTINRPACFGELFLNCIALEYAPDFPATSISPGCYAYTFQGCSSLKQAPELPATVMERMCYGGMFWGCSSLTQAPKLPSISLAELCYYRMFQDCTSLNKMPELPATALAKECYATMFDGCTSLTEISSLPASTLAEGCYLSMFGGCISLTQAPELPATIMEYHCYGGMFSGCSSLTTAPKLPSVNLAELCYDGMFMGCSALTLAPELPATTLASSCYRSMFSNCTSLTKAPDLLAKTLQEFCYETMFYGCTKLQYVRMKGEKFYYYPVSNFLNDWLKNVRSSGIIVLHHSLYNHIPNGVVPYGWQVEYEYD